MQRIKDSEIAGLGVDIIDVARVEALLRRDDDFLLGWFTKREIEELGSQARQAHIIASRVAVKEAVAKALGTGFAADVSWQDIEILTGVNGLLRVELDGGARAVATTLGVDRVLISVSHTLGVSIASAIAISARPSQGT